jgi:hypothetical protein
MMLWNQFLWNHVTLFPAGAALVRRRRRQPWKVPGRLKTGIMNPNDHDDTLLVTAIAGPEGVASR